VSERDSQEHRSHEGRPERSLEHLMDAVLDADAVDWTSIRSEEDPEVGALAIIDQITRLLRGTAPRRVQAEPAFRFGHLLVYESIGAGSFGEVYRAHDPRLARDVALKLARPWEEGRSAAASSFLAEARRLARIRHPNVLTVFGATVHEGRAGFWTDLWRGSPLEARLEAGPLSLEDAIHWGTQLCHAVAAVHAAGLIHGDITASNVLLDDTGHLVLVDFGSGLDEDSTGVGALGSPVCGTPYYMAPELFRGGSPSASSDLYAIGVLLHRVMTGRYPVEANSLADLIEHHARAAAPALSFDAHVPGWMQTVLGSLLSPTPEGRPASAIAAGEALRGPAGPPANLPAPTSRFIEREPLRSRIVSTVNAERLVTLVGHGGTGKTRLALEVASASLDAFPAGATWVALDSLHDPTHVPFALARALGCRDVSGEAIVSHLVDWLRGPRRLVVLDNCEHLSRAVAELLAQLLRGAPSLHVLATSREPLHVAGEHLVAVPPMGVPGGSSLEELSKSEAVRLFLERARAVRPEFSLTTLTASAVGEICRRLDGIPLAIELAAARLRALSVHEIAARLDDRFQLLGRGAGRRSGRQGAEGSDRHQTLESLLDWSHDLLEPEERRLFHRLAVFPGTFSLESVEEVCHGGGIAESDILDLLTGLVDRSLVETVVDRATGATRYQLLETVRSYAGRHLDAEDHARVVAAHRKAFSRLVTETERGLVTPDAPSVLARWDTELTNLIDAATPRPGELPEVIEERAVVGGALAPYWEVRGMGSLGRRISETLLARRRPEDRSETWAKLVLGLGATLIMLDDLAESKKRFLEAADLYHALGIERQVATCFSNLSSVSTYQRAFDEAKTYGLVALEITRKTGYRAMEGYALGALGLTYFELEDLPNARRYTEEAIDVHRERGDRRVLSTSVANLAAIANEEGRLDEAVRLLEECQPMRTELGDQMAWAHGQATLSVIRVRRGELTEARAAAKDALEILATCEHREWTSVALLAWSMVAISEGDHANGVRAHGAAMAILAQQNLPERSSSLRQALPYLDDARSAMGDEAFEAAHAEGRTASLDALYERLLISPPSSASA